MTGSPQWTGRIRKGDEAGTITGWIQDAWQWRIEIVGRFDEASREYVVTGTTGEVPATLRITTIDGEEHAGSEDRKLP
ncbi:MAG TPA: hypothetical protein VL614_21500 [Acetobacteraceae bacterium]|jgi:hypothetical protein|nr:hypothetical protein [Acetobacteraceae bacterium]